MNEEIYPRFLADTVSHKLTVIRDEGLYRHLQFRKPGTTVYGFDIVTWPHWLCYTGDMGSYTFTRIEDMFEFFRRAPKGSSEPIQINSGYWGEKVVAADRNGAVREFSGEKFAAHLMHQLDSQSASDDLREAVAEQLLPSICGSESDAIQAAEQFQFDGKVIFHDLWDQDFQAPSYRFLWCCYALAWGIREYDEGKTGTTAGVTPALR